MPTSAELLASLRGHLTALDTARVASDRATTTANLLQNTLTTASQDPNHDQDVTRGMRNSLNGLYVQIRDKANQEIVETESALAQIAALMDALKTEEAALALATSAQAAKVEKIKQLTLTTRPLKKRKLSPGPESAGLASSVPLHSPSVNMTPTTSKSYAGPMSAKNKRDMYSSQLPLLPGRPVAFRQPMKKLPDESGSSANALSASPGSSESTWILARVKKCLGGDKNRYEVQDVEDDNVHGPTYNTTLRSLIPLPWPSAKDEKQRGWPATEYLPGTPVHALFPDTSCFYRGIVKGAASRKKSYYIQFEDDDALQRSVAAEFVVESRNT